MSRWATVISKTEMAKGQMKRIVEKKDRAQERFNTFKKKYPRAETPDFYLKGEPQLTLKTPKESLESLKNNWLEMKGKLNQSAISERDKLAAAETLAVSYTHLDVYKRQCQYNGHETVAQSGCFGGRGITSFYSRKWQKLYGTMES